LAKAPA
jgi:hypothetical protein